MKHLDNIREIIWSNKDYSAIIASCLPAMSLNDGYYTVTFMVQEIDNERVVIYAHCTCVWGRGLPNDIGADSMADCKHSAAMFFYINSKLHRSTSKTDIKLTFKEPSKKKLELYPPGQTFQDRVKKSSGFKRNYVVKDEEAILKVQRLMEEFYPDDLHQRGLYKIITARVRTG